jgi:thioredoxin-related protein
MKKCTLSLFLLMTIVSSWSQVNFIQDDLKKALDNAKSEKKYIMVDVYADWCGWCKKMDASTFKDAEVSGFVNANMVALKLNSEKGDGVAFAQKFNVSGLPTIVYLDSKGNLVRTAPGYKTASQLMKEVEAYKLKRKNVNMSEYIAERVNYTRELKTKLPLEVKDGTQIAKALEMGEKNQAYEFDSYKASFANADPLFLAKMDVFYLLGKEKYDQVQENITSQKLVSEFTQTQVLYLCMILLESGEKKMEMLQMVNEHCLKTKDANTLETKAAVQYFVGDVEDAKKTLKAVGKLYKKKKMTNVKSFQILKALVYQS